MTGWRRAAAGTLVLVGLASPAAAADDPPAPSTVLFTLQGDSVYESSGLVDLGDRVVTTNDSGDGPTLYTLDPRSGRTVARTTYAEDATDVEALAPGPAGTVWAGDIGDNRGNRDDVTVYRLRSLPDGRVDADAYPLVYPDGPHNAEALLVRPHTGRVFVVSKSPFGGTVYVAPRTLHTGGEPNRLRVFARVNGLVTDGSFYPDGKHVVLRTYGTATGYTFPGFAPTGTVRLPSQPQGEGISVGADGRVLVSSEGPATDVLQVTLPASFTTGSPTAPAKTPTVRPTTPPAGDAAGERPSRTASQWGWTLLAAGGVGVLGWLTLRGSRLRGPRRR